MKRIQATILFYIVVIISANAQKGNIALKLKSQYIYDTATFPSAHASTIAETPKGMIAAWFGGIEEKSPDVEIYTSHQQKKGWSTPVSVANGVQADGKRFPCWNPVFFQVPGGELLLFYKVGPDPRNWWGELIRSKDHGKTWSKPERLPNGILGPIKNKPVMLNDGTLLCPTSVEYEDGRWLGYFEISADTAKTWTKTDFINDPARFNIIQPSVLFHDNKLQSLSRSKENRVVSNWSTDNGRTWSASSATELRNPNSGTDAVTISGGWHVIIYNPTEVPAGKWGGPRSPLNVAVSKDGINWKDIVALETEPGEFSYPSVIASKDGGVKISYTWNRKRIKFVSISSKELKRAIAQTGL